MKTATQAGWFLSKVDNFATGYDNYGHYFELSINQYGERQFHCTSLALSLGDLPHSVLRLLGLWMGMEFVA